jgi:hypothetical protein
MDPDPTLGRQDRPADETEDVDTGQEEEAAYSASPDEDMEAEARRERPGDAEEGPLDRVKRKAEELLDGVSGPDVPPSTEEERRA